MEEIKNYIESGILELYVMGDLPDEEKREVEAMAAKYPEIKAEISAIEAAVEGYAFTHAIKPSENLRDRVLQALDIHEDQADDEQKTVPLIPATHTGGFYRYAFAACLALLFISWMALFLVYSRLQNSKQRVAELLISNQQYSSRASYTDKELTLARTSLEVLRNPDFKMIRLQGTKNAPSSSMLVAFNTVKQEVMIDMSALKMPANDPQHQYQLWALVDGKPVDLGVFDSSADLKGMVKMKKIDRAQAFAVTLEPRGGSLNPTLEQMMALGNI